MKNRKRNPQKCILPEDDRNLSNPIHQFEQQLSPRTSNSRNFGIGSFVSRMVMNLAKRLLQRLLFSAVTATVFIWISIWFVRSQFPFVSGLFGGGGGDASN